VEEGCAEGGREATAELEAYQLWVKVKVKVKGYPVGSTSTRSRDYSTKMIQMEDYALGEQADCRRQHEDYTDGA